MALTAFIYGAWIITKDSTFGETVRGYPTLMVVILFLGGSQLVAVGILGEYIGRMFDESKNRPLYFLNEYLRPAVDLAATGCNPRARAIPNCLPTTDPFSLGG